MNARTHHFLRLFLKHVGLLQLEIRKQFTIYRNRIVASLRLRCYPENKTTKCTFGTVHRLETNSRAYEYNCRSAWCPPCFSSAGFSVNYARLLIPLPAARLIPDIIIRNTLSTSFCNSRKFFWFETVAFALWNRRTQINNLLSEVCGLSFADFCASIGNFNTWKLHIIYVIWKRFIKYLENSALYNTWHVK